MLSFPDTKLLAFRNFFGHCLHRRSCEDAGSSRQVVDYTSWHWSTASCSVRVKVDSDGLIAIVHAAEQTQKKWGSQDFPDPQSHVNQDKTVSYFHVHWDTSNVEAGRLEYPHTTENSCDGGTISGTFCMCDTTVVNAAMFSALPTRDEVLSSLFVGAFDPAVMDETYSLLVETATDEGVAVYKQSDLADYSEHTIFRVKDEHSNGYIFLKNVKSVVSVCNGAFFFRNSPTFYDIVDPQLISAYREVDAYLDYLDRHSNTPPFVCLNMLKHFGYSNPSTDHVFGCSSAYKTGKFTWINPLNSSDTISYGSGERGDLKAVAASILLSRDALSATLDSDPTFGGLKEPLHKLMQIMRGCKFQRSLTHRRTKELLSPSAQEILGQAPCEYYLCYRLIKSISTSKLTIILLYSRWLA